MYRNGRTADAHGPSRPALSVAFLPSPMRSPSRFRRGTARSASRSRQSRVGRKGAYGWSGRRESNPRFQLGKLASCHWTTPASGAGRGSRGPAGVPFSFRFLTGRNKGPKSSVPSVRPCGSCAARPRMGRGSGNAVPAHGGGEGNRTPVQNTFDSTFYMVSGPYRCLRTSATCLPWSVEGLSDVRRPGGAARRRTTFRTGISCGKLLIAHGLGSMIRCRGDAVLDDPRGRETSKPATGRGSRPGPPGPQSGPRAGCPRAAPKGIFSRG